MLLAHSYTVCLDKIATDGLAYWDKQSLDIYHSLWRQQLRMLSVPTNQCNKGIAIIEEAIRQTLRNARGRWILSQHQQAATELAVTCLLQSRPHSFVIDRTFVDDSKRWIIDYKSAKPDANTNINTWLQAQQNQYAGQLQRYAIALAKRHSGPIHAALYFPRFGGWIAWQPDTLTDPMIESSILNKRIKA